MNMMSFSSIVVVVILLLVATAQAIEPFSSPMSARPGRFVTSSGTSTASSSSQSPLFPPHPSFNMALNSTSVLSQLSSAGEKYFWYMVAQTVLSMAVMAVAYDHFFGFRISSCFIPTTVYLLQLGYLPST